MRAGPPRSQPNLDLGERGHGHRPAAWLAQSRSEYDTGWAWGCVSEKHNCGFLTIYCFSETRDERQSRNWDSRKQKFQEN